MKLRAWESQHLGYIYVTDFCPKVFEVTTFRVYLKAAKFGRYFGKLRQENTGGDHAAVAAALYA